MIYYFLFKITFNIIIINNHKIILKFVFYRKNFIFIFNIYKNII